MAPSVAEFYAGKNIFITGATGFVGKVLIEKLLRCCPDVDTIYILLRPKKGVSSEERLRDLCNNKCFERIREQTPERFKKLKLMAGDILEEGLGLTEEDTIELRERCHIVFHSAACVRFDQSLKDAINLNTGGTQRVLELSTTLKHLIAHVHLSTAYCRCELPELQEKLYPAMHKPSRILDVCQWMDDNLLAHMEPKLIGTEPNTYSYTKAITEDLVADYADKIPIAIGRPSIVSPAWKEPFPGWVDNLNGPTGLVIGSGKGVIRTMHCEPSYVADAIPVDVCANACILIAQATALNSDKKLKIYNITLSGIISMKWQDIIELGQKWVNVYPHTIALWYPGGSLKSYWLSHQIDVILFHIIPAYIVDALLLLFGRKTFMVKIQKRISNGLVVLQSYTVKEWHFINRNFRALREKISKEDDETFFTDVSTLSVDAYLKDYILGAREFCCKEDPSTLPRARKIHRIRFFLHYGVKILFYVFLIWWVYSNSHILTNSVQYLDKTLKTWMPGVRQSKIVIDEL